MSSIKEYFSDLGNGFASLIKGLAVTGKEFVTPKITERYPENRKTHEWPERFRAKLELIYDKDGNYREDFISDTLLAAVVESYDAAV